MISTRCSSPFAPPAPPSEARSLPERAGGKSCWRIPPATWSSCSNRKRADRSARYRGATAEHTGCARLQECVSMGAAPEDPANPALGERRSASEVLLAFLKLGLTSFGGPIAHIAYFRKDLIIRRRWMSETAYADIVAL